MELGTILSVAQTLLSALQCSELKEICSILGYNSQLDDLQHTVSTVKAVLRDAEAKQDLSHEAQIWIQELKDAVYDADDLLDKFITLVEQKQHLKGQEGKASNTVRVFFSRFNPFAVAYSLSRGVRKLRKKLDAVANNHKQFGFSVDYQPIRRRREETCSYVYAGTIIGRENDVENIVRMLLDYNNAERNVSFVTIVGIGGLGKTALAQLVYNDERVVKLFPLRLWACISDHDQKQLDIELILGKIWASVTGHKDEGSTMDWMQSQLREKLASNRFLLVLDDVWTESRSQWLKLTEFLLRGQTGSWIVVTTRSQETARIVGDGLKYELQGLSEENSWSLFERTAFGSEQFNSQDDLVKIGQEIVEGCARAPLAIRVVGSLLYGQDKSKWLSFKKIGIAKSRESHNDIMPILKLSYHNLEPPLKSCFSYCALFPKDFAIEKKVLINLWMAQGFIVPLDEGQSMEDAGEEYFSILLRRCFFQDIRQDKNGEITLCKIHDLMHDIAQQVAGKEICRMNSTTGNVDKSVRHLSLMRCESTTYSFTKTNIRSFLQVGMGYQTTKIYKLSLEALLANCMYLRALDLSHSSFKSLPDSIGALLHLRIELSECRELQHLSGLGSLCHLKVIDLENLSKLEYVENSTSVSASTGLSSGKGLSFFPSLERLRLYNLPMLKGWSRSGMCSEVGDRDHLLVCRSRMMQFSLEHLSQLKTLLIRKCPGLTSFPICSRIEDLNLRDFNKRLRIIMRMMDDSSSNHLFPKLMVVRIDKVAWLNFLPMEAFQSLTYMEINYDKEVESLEQVRDVFQSCSSSLQSFCIEHCPKLNTLLGGLGKLRALEMLYISGCANLSISEEKEDGIGMPWRSLHKLRSLQLRDLPKLVHLPKGMQYLTALNSLQISYCEGLESLPDWMPKLVSLCRLDIQTCSVRLKEKCQDPSGEDWPNIQHIPSILLL